MPLILAEMEKVSVILTTYNSEKTLGATVNSILSQEGEGYDFEIEMIVVDDCSTDSTTSILKRLGINYFSTERNSGGPNKGRNIGLKHSTGEYIAFIDHDDYWEAEKTRIQLRYAKKYPIVTCGYRIVDTHKGGNINRSNKSTSPFINYEPNETFLNILSRSKKRQNTYFGSILIRSDLKNVLFEEHFGMVDYDWLLKLFHNQPSAEVPLFLVKRFVNGANLSLNELYRKNDYYLSLHTLESYEDLYPKEVSKGVKSLHGSRARYFYTIDNMKRARRYFRKTMLDTKTIMYYLTSYFGSQFVRRNYNVFG